MTANTQIYLRLPRPVLSPRLFEAGIGTEETIRQLRESRLEELSHGLMTPTIRETSAGRFGILEQSGSLGLALFVSDAAFGKDDLLEASFCPGDDGFTRWHYVLSRTGGPREFHYCPTDSVHSTKYEVPRLLECFRDEAEGDFIYFLRLNAEALYADSDRWGLHVGASLGGKYRSWTYCSGNGGQDASSYGLVIRRLETTIVAVSRAFSSGSSLRIHGTAAGEACAASSWRISAVDPAGCPLEFNFATDADQWELELPGQPRLAGRYAFEMAPGNNEGIRFAVDFVSSSGLDRAFCLSVTNDPPVTMRRRNYTVSALEEEARLMAQTGINRLHWIEQAPLASQLFPTESAWDTSTLLCGGNLLRSVVSACRHEAVEVVADLKIFDMGANVFLFDRPADNTISDLDGRWYRCSPDIARRQDLTLSLPSESQTEARLPVTKLTLYSETPLDSLTVEKIRIRLSFDNHRYDDYCRPLQLRQGRVERSHFRWTPLGDIPEEGTRTNWFIELSGLQLAAPYCEIDFGSDVGTATHRGFALLEAEDASGNRAPITLAAQGARDLARGDGHFFWKERCRWFNATEPLFEVRQWGLTPLAMAFRIFPRLPTLLDVLMEETHDIWLGWVDRILASGADGVSIRTLCHHNGVESYAKYAWGESVYKNTQIKVPITPGSTIRDATELRRLRGEAFLAFLQKASERVRNAGKKFALQVECGFELTASQECRMQMAVDIPAVLRRGLVDEISLKWLTSQSRWAHERILPLAHQRNVPVHVISRNLENISNWNLPASLPVACQDARSAGLKGYNLYEWFNLTSVDDFADLAFHPEVRVALAKVKSSRP